MMGTTEEKIKQIKGPIFIFGASGFIGANLFQTIFGIRKDCYALIQDFNASWRLKLLHVPEENIIHCDITSPLSVKNAFEQYHPQTVFNLSAYGAYSKQSEARIIYDTNFTGTLNILENCKSITACIHAGSSSEYGFNSAAPLEKDELLPNSHYAVSKVACSYLIQYYSRSFHVSAVNLRLYSVYGRWEEPDRLMPRLIENARHGKFPPLVSPDISRDFVYIDDVLEAFIHAAHYISPEIAGKSFNIATGRKTTLKELVEVAAKEFHISDAPHWGSMDKKEWDNNMWYGNAGLANSVLHWKANTLLEDGLRKTFHWQDENDYETTILPAFTNRQLNPLISVVIACYDDARAIPMLYERLVKMFNSIDLRYEIIFLNDCSPDNTGEVLAGICEKDSDVIAVSHSRNFGSQAAFISGMEIASGGAIVLMDGDMQDPPEVISAFYEKWKEGYEVVYGRRVEREASWILNLFFKGFYRLLNKIAYINIPVDAGDFSMIDRKVVKELLALPETEQFIRGLRAWVGFKQTGVDYIRPKRMFGRSTNNWRKYFRWAKKAIFSFSFVPLDIIAYLGIVCTAIAIIAGVALVIFKLNHHSWNWHASAIITIVLFFSGIQMLSTSFNGEYIIKILEETKKRPKFIRSNIRKGGKIYSGSNLEEFIAEHKAAGR